MKYRELVGKFKKIQSECQSLAWEMSRELSEDGYDEDQRGWLEDVAAKLDDLADF